MRTLKQIQASRANGALSRGPATPAGKARSALNGVTHGITARTVVLANESRDRFETLLQALIDRYQPADQAEFLCVEEMAWAKWRLRRMVSYETALSDDAIARETLTPHQALRAARAYEKLEDASAGFRGLRRHESAHHRAYFRSLHELLHLQATRAGEELQTEPNNE